MIRKNEKETGKVAAAQNPAWESSDWYGVGAEHILVGHFFPATSEDAKKCIDAHLMETETEKERCILIAQIDKKSIELYHNLRGTNFVACDIIMTFFFKVRYPAGAAC